MTGRWRPNDEQMIRLVNESEELFQCITACRTKVFVCPLRFDPEVALLIKQFIYSPWLSVRNSPSPASHEEEAVTAIAVLSGEESVFVCKIE